LSLSPAHGPPSQPSDPCSSFSSNLFDDWLEANDMVVSVYITLTVDALISRMSTTTAPPNRQESCAGSSSAQQSRSWAAPWRRPRGRKLENIGALRGRSKRIKKTATKCALVVPSPHGAQLSAADFDQSEWEIMYPRFVEEDLVDPCNQPNKKNV
jgi:hypothetical protein